MTKDADEEFFARADAHIHLSNDQAKQASPGQVSASMMFATARFNAWLTATGFESGAEMKAHREENIEYFVTEYRKMLGQNMDEYIARYEQYAAPAKT